MPSRPPRIRLNAAGTARLSRTPHPWLYRDHLADAGSAAHGDTVVVEDAGGRIRGHAFYSAHSKISLRLLNRDEQPPADGFWRERVERAVAHRRRIVEQTDAYRALFSESDGIPGLVADLYGRHLVVQLTTAGAERVLDPVLDALAAVLPIESVLCRNDAAVRRLEQLPREVRQQRGTTPAEIEFRAGQVRYLADPFNGQKTGAFLDQRENREAAARYAAGSVLDVFSYHGSFALHAASRAERVEAVDSSVAALERGRRHAELNRLANLTFTAENAFEGLRRRQREAQRWDMIVLDPPAFAKNRSELAAARRGYKEINLRAMGLLNTGGVLVTCSCSYNLGEGEFARVIEDAARDSGRGFRLLERRGQARDHPVLVGFPESSYLKCLILEAT